MKIIVLKSGRGSRSERCSGSHHCAFLILWLTWSIPGQTWIIFKPGLTRITRTKRDPVDPDKTWPGWPDPVSTLVTSYPRFLTFSAMIPIEFRITKIIIFLILYTSLFASWEFIFLGVHLISGISLSQYISYSQFPSSNIIIYGEWHEKKALKELVHRLIMVHHYISFCFQLLECVE